MVTPMTGLLQTLSSPSDQQLACTLPTGLISLLAGSGKQLSQPAGFAVLLLTTILLEVCVAFPIVARHAIASRHAIIAQACFPHSLTRTPGLFVLHTFERHPGLWVVQAGSEKSSPPPVAAWEIATIVLASVLTCSWAGFCCYVRVLRFQRDQHNALLSAN
mmetsp:Transcript_46055/g.108546  ORF Transcript_46055/g.108546 Transcript_46055/m.108546 type:complete len:161 (+) Transcript_46055:315-797(+)